MVTSQVIEGESEAKEPLPPVSPWSKVLVALAGPAMNVLFAFVLATGVYFLGLPIRVNPAIIGGVEPGSPEAKMGIHAGDRIVAVNDKLVTSWDDVQMTTAMAPTNVLPVTVERAGVKTTYGLTAKVNEDLGLKLLNLEPSERPIIEEVRPAKRGRTSRAKAG